MKKIVYAEILFLFLLSIAGFAIWYDSTCDPSPTISQWINKLIHWQPVIAFGSGTIFVFVTWWIHKLWEIKFRYVLALLVLGICIGHLFWSQDHSVINKNGWLWTN